MTPAQENGDYDPSLVSEALSQIEHAEDPNQDIELLKDVAAQTYVGEFSRFTCLLSSSRLTERHLRRSRYHWFSSWDVLLGDGMLSPSAEEGSRRTR